MARVFQDTGEDTVDETIGVDATGQAFNSIVAIEQYKGKEMNPLVNAGAIATTSMVEGQDADEVCKTSSATHSAFAGRPLTVNEEVYKSEAETNQRNQAIGALMFGVRAHQGATRSRPSTSTRGSARSTSTRRTSR